MSENQEEIHVEENVPWGEDTLFTLEFREEANKYAIHTCTNMYLQKDGKLSPEVNKVRIAMRTDETIVLNLRDCDICCSYTAFLDSQDMASTGDH